MSEEQNYRVAVIANSLAVLDGYYGSPYPYDYNSCLAHLRKMYRWFVRLAKVMPYIHDVDTNRARRLRTAYCNLRDGFFRLPKYLQDEFCPDLDEILNAAQKCA